MSLLFALILLSQFLCIVAPCCGSSGGQGDKIYPQIISTEYPWDDDYVLLSNLDRNSIAFSWDIEPWPGIVTTTNMGSFHGPYNEPTSLFRQFACDEYSSVSISFFAVACGTTDVDSVTLYLNDDIHSLTADLNHNSQWDNVPEPLVDESGCEKWHKLRETHFSSSTFVEANVLFDVELEVSVGDSYGYSNSWLAFSRVVITCNPPQTPSPTEHQTTTTSTQPTFIYTTTTSSTTSTTASTTASTTTSTTASTIASTTTSTTAPTTTSTTAAAPTTTSTTETDTPTSSTTSTVATESTTTSSTLALASTTTSTATTSSTISTESTESTASTTSTTLGGPGEGRVDDDTETTDTESDESNNGDTKSGSQFAGLSIGMMKGGNTVYVIIGCVLCAILCCAICVYSRRRMNKAIETQRNMEKSVEVDSAPMHIVSVSDEVKQPKHIKDAVSLQFAYSNKQHFVTHAVTAVYDDVDDYEDEEDVPAPPPPPTEGDIALPQTTGGTMVTDAPAPPIPEYDEEDDDDDVIIGLETKGGGLMATNGYQRNDDEGDMIALPQTTGYQGNDDDDDDDVLIGMETKGGGLVASNEYQGNDDDEYVPAPPPPPV